MATKKIDLAAQFNSFQVGNSKNKEDNAGIGKLGDASKSLIADRIYTISAGEIDENPLNATIYTEDNLEPLAKDIASRGIRQPLIVKQEDNGRYMIISGHRRFAASRLAADKFGYNASFLPCMIKKDDETTSELQAIILDNIQRDKTSYEKMNECVALKNLAEAEKEKGILKIVNVWDYITERYGFSKADIARYTKIHDSLIPEIMEHFKASHLATNVAYEVSKEQEKIQKQIATFWDGADNQNAILTLPAVLNIKTSLSKPDKKASRKSGNAAVYKDMRTGIEKTAEQIFNLQKLYSNCESKLSKRDNRLLLKKLNKLYMEIAAIESELKLKSDNPEE